MIMILMRILAQIIDIVIALAVLVLSFIYALPVFAPFFMNDIMFASVVLLLIDISLIFLIQYPFLKNNQSLGKGFASLQIESTNKDRPLTLALILHREIVCKLMSCYVICVPVLAGHPGGHEEATETRVIRIRRGRG